MNLTEENAVKEDARTERNAEASEEIEDETLRETDRKKKARLRTRGPYRKALIEKQHD
jgi:hypothetical protein